VTRKASPAFGRISTYDGEQLMSASRILPALCAVVPMIPLAGCAVEPSLYLVPISNRAYSSVLIATMAGYGQGHGALKIAARNGEIFEGEYSIYPEGLGGFGSILALGHGPKGCASTSGYTTDFALCGIGEGVATLISDRGGLIQCEFVNDDPKGHGWGTCRSSAGTTYRMLY
jgi:hypothetical protein